MKLRKQMLDGNVETMLLAILETGPSYGYAIVRELEDRSAGLLRMGEGTVYPVLHRLEDKKLIAARWRTAESGRKRKYYQLTASGKRALAENLEQWRGLTQAMGRVLDPVTQAS
jgi:transcriptional regulator